MRKIILTGVAAVIFTMGAAGTGAMAYSGLVGRLEDQASPYALYAPQTLHPSGPIEGRSVYEGRRTNVYCHGDQACDLH
jgi:hypothetical protein